MSNGQFRKIDEVVRVDDTQIAKAVPVQNNVCHKLQVPERIAQEVGKIIELHNGVLPRDISVRFVEKQANEIAEQIDVKPDQETQEVQESLLCTDEHLVLFIISHFYESHGVPVNITIECSLEETESKLKSDQSSTFSRSLFIILYIPLLLLFLTLKYLSKEKDDIYKKELVRIHSSYKKSSKSTKKSHRKEVSKESLSTKEITENLIQKLLSGDQKSKLLITNDTITMYQASLDQEISENHNILIRIILKLCNFVTDGCLLGWINRFSCTRFLKQHFEKFLLKFGNLLQIISCEELSDEASPSHDHLYSTDEDSSSEADFVGPISERSKGKAKKDVKEVKKSKYAS